jgi:hypothetical protein
MFCTAVVLCKCNFLSQFTWSSLCGVGVWGAGVSTISLVIRDRPLSVTAMTISARNYLGSVGHKTEDTAAFHGSFPAVVTSVTSWDKTLLPSVASRRSYQINSGRLRMCSTARNRFLCFIRLLYSIKLQKHLPITVAARSKAWTVFACSNAGIAGSNPTESMDVSVRLFCLCCVCR